MNNLCVLFLFPVLFVLQTGHADSTCEQRLSAAIHPPLAVMNTEKLLTWTTQGNPSRAGIDAIWSSYKVLNRVFGFKGPLGPSGPLSNLGSIGDRPYNPWFWWSRALERDIWAYAPDHIFSDSGPLSPNGILSDKGPLARDWGEGSYAILGTRGPLGPLGPLGPIGPMGALGSLGYRGPNPEGDYFHPDTGIRVKEIVVHIEGKEHRLGLMERYTFNQAYKKSQTFDLDTSFMTDGQLGPFEMSKELQVKASFPQLISIMIVPEKGLMLNSVGMPQKMNFSLEVLNEKSAKIIESDRPFHINFVQLAVPQEQILRIRVKRQGVSVRPQHFRLIVMSAAASLFRYFPDISQGDHLIEPYEEFEKWLEQIKTSHSAN